MNNLAGSGEIVHREVHFFELFGISQDELELTQGKAGLSGRRTAFSVFKPDNLSSDITLVPNGLALLCA